MAFSLSGALSWVNELAETCRGLRRSKFKQNADWGRSPPLFFCSYFEFQKIELKGCAWVSVGRRAGAGAPIPEVDFSNYELRIPFDRKFRVKCQVSLFQSIFNVCVKVLFLCNFSIWSINFDFVSLSFLC